MVISTYLRSSIMVAIKWVKHTNSAVNVCYPIWSAIPLPEPVNIPNPLNSVKWTPLSLSFNQLSDMCKLGISLVVIFCIMYSYTLALSICYMLRRDLLHNIQDCCFLTIKQLNAHCGRLNVVSLEIREVEGQLLH